MPEELCGGLNRLWRASTAVSRSMNARVSFRQSVDEGGGGVGGMRSVAGTRVARKCSPDVFSDAWTERAACCRYAEACLRRAFECSSILSVQGPCNEPGFDVFYY